MNLDLTNLNQNKTRRNKTTITTLIINLIICAVFIGLGVVMMNMMSPPSHYVEINGEIIDSHIRRDDSISYAPIVKYTVNGQNYTVTGNSFTSNKPSTGETRKVMYNPSNPSESRLASGFVENLLILIFPVFGIIGIFGTIFFFIKSRKRDDKITSLKTSGQKISGVISEIRRSSIVKDNQTVYNVIVAANYNGAVKFFESDGVISPALSFLEHGNLQQNPIPIDIYVNPTNTEEYYVDIDGMPELTPETINQLLQQSQPSQNQNNTNSNFPPTMGPQL